MLMTRFSLQDLLKCEHNALRPQTDNYLLRTITFKLIDDAEL